MSILKAFSENILTEYSQISTSKYFLDATWACSENYSEHALLSMLLRSYSKHILTTILSRVSMLTVCSGTSFVNNAFGILVRIRCVDVICLNKKVLCSMKDVNKIFLCVYWCHQVFYYFNEFVKTFTLRKNPRNPKNPKLNSWWKKRDSLEIPWNPWIIG